MNKVAALAIASCLLSAFGSLVPAADLPDDAIYYTRVGFFYENGTHKTVNYLRGVWVPVNTRVEVLKAKRRITVRIVETGEHVDIVNAKEYTGVDQEALFDRMFSREAIDLSMYSPKQVTRIKGGNFEPGMTKDEIILAIGYPPAHRTPSLNSNTWRYWRSRFDTVLLYFKDGVLDRIKD